MEAALILSIFFLVGFFAGYAVRAWRSRRRRAHYLMYAPYRAQPKQMKQKKPYEAKPQASAFGHARRAF
jgi:hypothetical protein